VEKQLRKQADVFRIIIRVIQPYYLFVSNPGDAIPLSFLRDQVKEKQLRKQANLSYQDTLVSFGKEATMRSEDLESRKKERVKERHMAHADELRAQIRMQQERKLMEPFLMSRAERQMNAALLRRVPQ